MLYFANFFFFSETDEVQNQSVPQPENGAVGLPLGRSGADGRPCPAEWGRADHIR